MFRPRDIAANPHLTPRTLEAALQEAARDWFEQHASGVIDSRTLTLAIAHLFADLATEAPTEAEQDVLIKLFGNVCTRTVTRRNRQKYGVASPEERTALTH